MKLNSIFDLLPIIPKTGTIVLSHAVSTSTDFISLLVENAKLFRNLEIIHMVPVAQPYYCDEIYSNSFVHNALFAGQLTKVAIRDNRAHYTPILFSQVPEYLGSRKIDLFVTQVSAGINENVSLGVSVDYAISAIKSAKIVVGIQNDYMPYTFGDGVISIKNFNYICESNTPLLELNSSGIVSPAFQQIASHIKPLVCDGATLQLGIGALPDTILKILNDKNDLGVHSEMVSDGIVSLVDSGNITNKRKKNNIGKSVVSFAMGRKNLYDYIDNNDKFLFKNVDYVNNPSIISENDNVVSINSALQVDLHGQVNAEMIDGVQISGVGGQVDFVRGARLSKNGKSIIAFPSTSSDGTVSRIIRKIGTDGVVTTSRNDVDYICTEYGVVKLSGKTLREREELLLSIAHPKFRDSIKGGC